MRNVVAARELLQRAAAAIELPAATLETIFLGAPTDFRVIIGSRLPFRIERFGMAGITLFGTVYLHEAVLGYSPVDLIVLVRHEAEHIRQQRASATFYARYLIGWLQSFLLRRGSDSGGGVARRWHDAYMSIPAECEAYAAGDRARDLINRK